MRVIPCGDGRPKQVFSVARSFCLWGRTGRTTHRKVLETVLTGVLSSCMLL